MTVLIAKCELCGEVKLTGWNGCLKKQACSSCLAKNPPKGLERLTEAQLEDSLLVMKKAQEKEHGNV